jgi:nicotinamide riboside transporter PnuC
MKKYYDPGLDTIYGCEPGTYSWHHENRHRQQYKKGKAELLDQLYVICYYASFLCALGGWIVGGPWGMIKGIGLAFLPHVISQLYLETDAYLVGWWQWRKER